VCGGRGQERFLHSVLGVPHAEQEMLTLPEHQISPLVFIEVHVVLSFVSLYFLFIVIVLSSVF